MDTVDSGSNSGEGTASKVEVVTSSLADGLRLSPCSENSALSEPMSPNNADGDDGTAMISAPPTYDVQEFPSLMENEKQVNKIIQQIMMKELLQRIWVRNNNRRNLILLLQLLQTMLPLLLMHILVVQMKVQMKPMQMVSYVHLVWT